MISCYLSGGLGNQLFQIFATLAYCIQYNKPFVFPYSKNYLNENNRPTYWENLLYQLKTYTSAHISLKEEEILSFQKYCEPHHTYTPIPANIEDENGNALLKGFFQSDKYFENYYHRIAETLGLSHLRANLLIECGLFGKPDIHTVSMHFRMGDYNKLRCYHPVMSPIYYIDALNTILQTKSLYSSKVIVYCFFEKEDEAEIDDYLRTISQNIKGENVEFEKIKDKYSDWQQMLIMSGCDDHIIANSTFSWWSAYINPSPFKMVCYPDVWYGHQLYYINTRDLFPEGWIRIQTNKEYYSALCKCL